MMVWDIVRIKLLLLIKPIKVGASQRARRRGDAVAQSVERATPREVVPGSIPSVAALYWLGGCQYNVTGRDRSHGLPALSHMRQHEKLSDALSWGPSAI